MALPNSPNTVYAPGVQVPSADLNELQDGVVEAIKYTEHYALLGGESTNGADTIDNTGWNASAGASVYTKAINARAGQRILEIRIRFQTAVSTNDVELKLVKSLDGVASDVATTTAVEPGTTAITTITLSSIDHDVENDAAYIIHIDAVDAFQNYDVYQFEIDYESAP